MIAQYLERAEVLLEQERFIEAESQIKKALESDPTNVFALFMLAQCYYHQNKEEKANEYANEVLRYAPDWYGIHLLKAKIKLSQEKHQEAIDCAQRAIEIEPEDADSYAVQALAYIDLKEFEQGLDKANHALSLEPENMVALNARSAALVKLGRREESFETMEYALSESPNQAFNHANYGWILLEKGKIKEAKQRFQEALRINPNLEHARSGMAEALKARNPLYNLFLKYQFFMGKQKKGSQWGYLIGFYLVYRFVIRFLMANESFRPLAYIIVPLFLILIFGSWFITALSNFVISFDQYGKHLLDEEEKLGGYLVGGSAILAIVSIIVFLLTKNQVFAYSAGFFFLIMIPLGSMFAETRPKNILKIITAVLFLLGFIGMLQIYLGIQSPLLWVFFFGVVGYTWVTNFFIIQGQVA